MKGIQKREFLSCCMSHHICIKFQVCNLSDLLSPVTSLSVIVFLFWEICWVFFLCLLSVGSFTSHLFSFTLFYPSIILLLFSRPLNNPSNNGITCDRIFKYDLKSFDLISAYVDAVTFTLLVDSLAS